MGSWFSGRRSIAANSRRASKKDRPTLPIAMLVIAFFGRRFPTTPLSAAPNSGITGTSQRRPICLQVPGDFEIGRFLDLKSEIRNCKLDWGPIRDFEISDLR